MRFYNCEDKTDEKEYNEWCEQECDPGIKNKDFVKSFLEKYLKWIKKQKTVVGIETRELKIKDYMALHKKKISKIFYYMSI
tara:strand:- start:353 stop:595 length:243 start_codon:yes stop_codon:yes gene_type:complete